MKKIILFLLVASLGLSAMAQMGPLPIDPKTRKGTLPNGMTYYIRHNTEPKGQAEFFIAQKVGSMQEEENQRGLAHFLEHMAFNGLKNFPGKSLFTFTESIGVKFGENLNAGTGFEETIYNLSAVPVSREGIIDSCLLVLHDWANELLLLPEEIDAERGVIREEWRTRNSAYMRIYDKLLPVIYPGNRYAQRMPIGLISVIDNFKPQELRDYYEKWYRPDHQGIVVVGDIDVDLVEAKIKTLFNDIPTPTTPSPLTPFTVESNEKPIIAFATDPEMTMTSVSINYKYEPIPAEVQLSAQGLVISYLQQMVTSMLNSRLQEISQKTDAPFIGAESYTGDFFVSRGSGAFTIDAACKEGGMSNAFTAVVQEIARVKQHGFTASEYERAKANYLSMIEKAYNERDKRKSESYARECVRNFSQNEVMPGVETEYAIANQVAPMITVEQVNQLAQQMITEKDIVMMLIGPEKTSLNYPSTDEFLALYEKGIVAPVEAYQDDVSDEPLIAELPKAGKISKQSTNKLFEAKEFILSNGVKVIVKETDFKDDEIVFTAASHGGSSLFGDADILQAKVINEIIGIGGVGNFSQTALRKAMAGKRAHVHMKIGLNTENMNGNCSPKDLETLMQLIYLNATAQRYDEEAFGSFLNRKKAELENIEANPMKALQDTLTLKMFGNNPRMKALALADLEKVDYKRCMELINDRYKDMGDFVFTFVGNIDEATFIPLMNQYLGALPNLKRKEAAKDLKISYLQNDRISHFEKEMQTVKTTVVLTINGNMPYNLTNLLHMSAFQQILDMVFTAEIREKEGGTYGVGVMAQLERLPKDQYNLLILFDTDPVAAKKLLDIVYRELNKIAAEGPNLEQFEKMKAFMQKDVVEKQRDNNVWLSAINEYAIYKYDGLSEREALIKAMKPADIQAIAKNIMSQKNKAEILMNGVEAKK